MFENGTNDTKSRNFWKQPKDLKGEAAIKSSVSEDDTESVEEDFYQVKK